MVVVVLVTPVGTVTGVTREETKVRRSVRIGKAMSINTVGSPGRWRQRHAWIGVSRETPPFHLAQVGSNCRIALATTPAAPSKITVIHLQTPTTFAVPTTL